MSNRKALARYLKTNAQRWRDSAPLCPAGHLPHMGGDQTSRRLSPISNVVEIGEASKLLISPLVGLLQNWMDVIPCF